MRATRSYIAEHEGCERLDLYCVGRKGRDFFVKTRPSLAGQKVNFFNRLNFADAVQVVSDITGLYLREGYDRVDILYNEFGSAIRQVLTIKQFLPFVPAKPEGNIPLIDHIYEPNEHDVLSSLIPANLEVQMWRILLESYAAEMGAKMTAMDAATENADDLLSILTVRYNRARQAQITRELTEIVGGAESIGR
jgi:F-type H+-transporting ATPase subunit gamma